MVKLLSSVWALLLGIFLIMLGYGIHFTLIGLRGGLEGFSTTELAIITSGHFIGFLSGARFAPLLIRRVGHVRVFAALGSFMSAGLIAFPLITEPWAWTVLRVLIGFSISGIYVAAESWLNHAATNKSRGKMLSGYMMAQTLGLIGAQGLLTFGDPATSVLFIGASILVSISFAPILLSATKSAPPVEMASSMPLKALFAESPLSTVGIFLLGTVYATQLGMGAVYATLIGLSVPQVALFVAMLFTGALVLQYPIGWLSDHIDRRQLIFAAAVVGAITCLLGWLSSGGFWLLLLTAFIAGGVTTPLYALFLAYTNDFLKPDEMPAASSGLVFTFGLGAILGPLLTGWAMDQFGPVAFWLVLSLTFATMSLYAFYRMSQRPALPVEQTDSYQAVLPTSSPVAVEAWVADQVHEIEVKAEAEAEAEKGTESSLDKE